MVLKYNYLSHSENINQSKKGIYYQLTWKAQNDISCWAFPQFLFVFAPFPNHTNISLLNLWPHHEEAYIIATALFWLVQSSLFQVLQSGKWYSERNCPDWFTGHSSWTFRDWVGLLHGFQHVSETKSGTSWQSFPPLLRLTFCRTEKFGLCWWPSIYIWWNGSGFWGMLCVRIRIWLSTHSG